MKMEEKRRTIDRLLSDTPTSEAPSMTIKSVSSLPTRSVKVEEELLDAVEERVRKVLQVWYFCKTHFNQNLSRTGASTNERNLAHFRASNSRWWWNKIIFFRKFKLLLKLIIHHDWRQRISSLSDEETLLDSDLESLPSWNLSDRSSRRGSLRKRSKF